MHSSNHIKSADDMTVVDLISRNDESAYREEVQRLPDWCRTNHLSLNVDKTKEMVVDFRRTRRDHSPLHIHGSTVEIVKSSPGRGSHLVPQHQHHNQESPAASLLPAKAEEGTSPTSHPHHLLQRNHREHPEQLHHCLELPRIGSPVPAAESCVSQSISPLEEKVDAVEGETSAQTIDPLVGEVQLPEGDDLTLSCNYTTGSYTSGDTLFWYRQSPGSSPEHLLAVVSGSSISPQEEKVDAVEGQTVTLSCSYDRGGAGTPYLHWYRQYPRSSLEFLLLTAESGGYVTKAENLDARMSIRVHKEEKKKVDLEISSAAVSDSVLYYCALEPTVTGNPDTLYRNWFYD
ncbi:hypothetical protein NFI96_003014 [Prochilodus magdalenae]|nr:hypothetical protein NFI96_003014 [Prochilodus magdalenae]